jgi:hypothetical protein
VEGIVTMATARIETDIGPLDTKVEETVIESIEAKETTGTVTATGMIVEGVAGMTDGNAKDMGENMKNAHPDTKMITGAVVEMMNTAGTVVTEMVVVTHGTTVPHVVTVVAEVVVVVVEAAAVEQGMEPLKNGPQLQRVLSPFLNENAKLLVGMFMLPDMSNTLLFKLNKPVSLLHIINT